MLGDRPGLSQPALTTGTTHTLAAGLPRSGFVHGRNADRRLDLAEVSPTAAAVSHGFAATPRTSCMF